MIINLIRIFVYYIDNIIYYTPKKRTYNKWYFIYSIIWLFIYSIWLAIIIFHKCCVFVQEPSLFAVAKLLETGLVNLSRIDILWRPVTNHMLDVCQHPHIRMREWGVEAITYLVKAALQYKYQPPLKENQASTVI